MQSHADDAISDAETEPQIGLPIATELSDLEISLLQDLDMLLLRLLSLASLSVPSSDTLSTILKAKLWHLLQELSWI